MPLSFDRSHACFAARGFGNGCSWRYSTARCGGFTRDRSARRNKHALEALVNPGNHATTPGAVNTPPVTTLHLAMVQGAVYDAVNAIDGGHEPYLAGVSAAAGASQSAAAATAAYRVLVGFDGKPGLLDRPRPHLQLPTTAYTPSVRAAIKSRLAALYSDALAAAGGASDPAVMAGVAVGEDAAAEMLDARSGDGRYPATPAPFPVGTAPGEWRPTSGVNDPFGWVRYVDTFVVGSGTSS